MEKNVINPWGKKIAFPEYSKLCGTHRHYTQVYTRTHTPTQTTILVSTMTKNIFVPGR